MEVKWRWLLLTAIAPIAWGASYFVTSHTLPADAPIWGAAIRALPAGLLLMAFARRMPRGAWWWRSTLLGVMNVAVFFVLVYVAAQLLPSSVASSVQALTPVALAGFAWALVAERPTRRIALGALLGIGGVLLVVGAGTGRLDGWGIAAAATSMLLASLSGVLAKRWADGTPVMAVTAWQLVIGGALLVPFAFGFEGLPPVVDGLGWAGYAFMTLIATALAYWAWFTGLSKLPAATVGIVGLLNPVTGVLLGTLAAGELLGWPQWLGVGLVLGGILAAQAPAKARPTRSRSSTVHFSTIPGRNRRKSAQSMEGGAGQQAA
ncbi:MAG TPA: EamA family transporter [Microbacteriaceae bacterium]|nr:EamA family transporter [Microbacteriaceae bacterium]